MLAEAAAVVVTHLCAGRERGERVRPRVAGKLPGSFGEAARGVVTHRLCVADGLHHRVGLHEARSGRVRLVGLALLAVLLDTDLSDVPARLMEINRDERRLREIKEINGD